MSHAGGQSNGQGCDHEWDYDPICTKCGLTQAQAADIPKPAPRWRAGSEAPRQPGPYLNRIVGYSNYPDSWIYFSNGWQACCGTRAECIRAHRLCGEVFNFDMSDSEWLDDQGAAVAGRGSNAKAGAIPAHPSIGTRALEAAMAFRPDGKRFGGRYE